MHKKALLACLLVVAMLLSSCALIEKDEAVDRATEIIRVGDTVYTKGEILDEVDYQLGYMSYIYQMYGMSFDPTSDEAIADAKEQVINHLVEDAVKNIKVKELGLDQLTDEEQAELQENIDSAWQTNLDSVKSTYFADTELTGDDLTAALEAKCEEVGILKENVAEGQTITFNQNKLRESVIADVAVTDEELQAEYDSKVETAKTDYESNLSSYGASVNNGTTVYYRPAGYRMVKQILIKFHEEDQKLIDDINSEISKQTTAITSLTDSLTEMGVTNVDELVNQVKVTVTPDAAAEVAADAAEVVATVTDIVATGTDVIATGTDVVAAAADADAAGTAVVTFRTDVVADFAEGTDENSAELAKQLAEAKALEAAYQEQLTAATAAAFANIDAETDDVVAQLAAGADWDALMAEKTQDPGMQGDRDTAKTGYAVCENFSSFDASFTAAAMALENVGDVSPKTAGMYGYYIIQYTADVEEGPVPLDDVRETLSASLLTTKQDTVFTDTLAKWVEEANAKIDRKALDN